MRLISAFLFMCGGLAAQAPDPSGDWVATITAYGEPNVMRLKLERHGGGVSGTIWGNKLEGTVAGSSIEFECSYEEDHAKKSCGHVSAKLTAGTMSGSGMLFDGPVEFAAQRAAVQAATPKTHEFTPTRYYRQFTGLTEPVLKIKCVDAGGMDEKGEHKSQGGNPLTGPFYVEGAVPGDTLVVKLNRVRLNRDNAGIHSDSVVGSALSPWYVQNMKRVKDFDSSWKLDRESGTATLTKPTPHLRN